MYSSKIQAKIASQMPAVITIRPGAWPTTTSPGNATLENFDVDISEGLLNFKVKDYEKTPIGDVDISTSDLLLSVGRGIEEEANLELIFSTAEILSLIHI